MTLKELKINEDDFDVFLTLDPAEKIEFLWDAMHLGTQNSVNKQILKLDNRYRNKTAHNETEQNSIIMSMQDIQIGPYRLVIMNIDRLMILSSDNLKILRNFVRSMWLNGYMLHRRTDYRKAKDRDMMKYFMAFQVIGEVQPISEN